MNKELLASKLSNLTIREMTDVLKGKTILTFGGKKVLKHLADGDLTTSSTKFETVDLSTKKEVAKTTKQSVLATQTEIDDLTGSGLKNVTLSIQVKRVFPGGSDSSTFLVKDGLTYNKLLSEVNKFKK